MDALSACVYSRTTIGARYRAAAAPESMEWYLDDWQSAYDRLGRQIEELRCLRDQRRTEVGAGTWPPDKPEASA